MEYNKRRAILRRVKKGGDLKLSFQKMKEDSKFTDVTYREFLEVKDKFMKKKVIDGYKWCNVCGCSHPHTYEVFGYNGYKADGTRRLHSVCLKARGQIKKNIIIMRDKRYKSMRETQKRTREKNKHKWKSKHISDMTPEEQKIQREKWRKYSAKKYLKVKKARNEKN